MKVHYRVHEIKKMIQKDLAQCGWHPDEIVNIEFKITRGNHPRLRGVEIEVERHVNEKSITREG